MMERLSYTWQGGRTMDRVRADEVTAAEWRWVIIVSGLLVALTVLPYAWAFATDTTPDAPDQWQFMGLLYSHLDGATYLSKIEQGMRGEWLFTLTYTPENHSGAAINVYYMALGHIARVFGMSALVIFHLARLIASFFMYIAIYHLGSMIWQKRRPRRLFFALVGIGAGFGWLYLPLAGNVLPYPSDVFIPESIPFYSTLVNPHFPLAIAIMALLVATFLRVFRPGFADIPRTSNGGATVILLTMALCVVQPQAWVPLGAVLIATLGVNTVLDRRIPRPQLEWALLAILPAIPFFVYYIALTNANWAMQVWNAQNQTPSPSLDRYIIGYGLILLLAIPGIIRAVRHFERDGDRLMLLWIVVGVILLYIPINLQRRLAIGLIIPIAFFAVRSLEDFWFNRVARPLRSVVAVMLIVLVVPTNVLSLLIPLQGLQRPSEGVKEGLLMPHDTVQALEWLDKNSAVGQIALARPKPTGLWIPALTHLRVVYGHPYETLFVDDKKQEVEAWMTGTRCDEAVRKYNVRYILIESYDGTSPGAACLTALGLDAPLKQFGTAAIYEIR